MLVLLMEWSKFFVSEKHQVHTWTDIILLTAGLDKLKEGRLRESCNSLEIISILTSSDSIPKASDSSLRNSFSKLERFAG